VTKLSCVTCEPCAKILDDEDRLRRCVALLQERGLIPSVPMLGTHVVDAESIEARQQERGDDVDRQIAEATTRSRAS